MSNLYVSGTERLRCKCACGYESRNYKKQIITIFRLHFKKCKVATDEDKKEVMEQLGGYKMTTIQKIIGTKKGKEEWKSLQIL